MSNLLRRLTSEQRGWALVTASIVITLMMAVGLASFAVVDTQTNMSKNERTRESSFNLSEAALQNQGYLLGAQWPAKSAKAYTDCTSSTASSITNCPNPANLSGTAGNGSFNLADFKAATSWALKVRDNGSPPSDFYSSSVLSQPSWDANGDGKLWVWAQANVRGKPRTIVALLKREKLVEAFPRTAITAGHVSTCCGNSPKTLINATGSQVVVRCETSDPSCLDYSGTQIQGTIVQSASTPPAMGTDELARFKSLAQENGTYFTTCPSASQIQGQVVFVDPPTAITCSYQGNGQMFSPSAYGALIFTRGTFDCRGTYDLYGVLYHANVDNSSDALVQTQGNCVIHGAVAVDGNGGIQAGNSGGNAKDGNVVFDPNAFTALSTYGTAGLVQNTWRELPPLG